MLKRILVLYIAFVASLTAFANPARMGRIYLSQPDGSGFYARFHGDEMLRVKVTEDGCAIVQDESGWWCYAEYDSEGRKTSTGCRVGKDNVSNAIAKSREIPYTALAQARTALKSNVWEEEVAERDILSRIRKQKSTKATSDEPVDKFGLVILVQFKGQNEKFTYTKKDFEDMLTKKGYALNGATGSAKEYFDAQFNGKYNFTFDVSEIVTLDKEAAYYGGNNASGQDKNPHLMVMEACQLADAEINFAKYDQDGDGQVDNVFVFFAGNDEAQGASEDQIWSHAWYIKDGAGKNLILDGVRINRYACTSELTMLSYTDSVIASIGTFCHEYAHTFGLPDLYDTDYQEGGQAAATWNRLSLMDGGSYNNNGNTPPNLNAVEREVLGLNEPDLLVRSGKYALKSIAENKSYKIESDNDGEYYLLECRTNEGWDRYIGGSGMLIYHIDRSLNNAGHSAVYNRAVTAAQRWGNSNEVNAYAAHQCADLVEADGRRDSYTSPYDTQYQNYVNSLQGVFFPYGNVTHLSSDTYPGLTCWGDSKIDRTISSIEFDGTQASFKFYNSSIGALPVPTNLKVEAYQDAAIVKFSSSFAFSGMARIECKQSGQLINTFEVESYEESSWAYTLEGLDLSTSYVLYVYFFEGEFDGNKTSLSFMTKKKQNTDYPYIYLANVKRAEDGAFAVGAKLPLKLFNAQGAQEIKWTFNGNPITVGADCYYTVTRKGTLRAHITWEDGSEEVVMKEINIGETQDE